MSEPVNANLVDGIEQTVGTHVVSKLPPDSTAELSSMPLRALLCVSWTCRERFPAPRPRNVYRSKELDASPQARQYLAELAELDRKMTAGEDLTPHLSARVETAFIPET